MQLNGTFIFTRGVTLCGGPRANRPTVGKADKKVENNIAVSLSGDFRGGFLRFADASVEMTLKSGNYND